MDFRMKIRLQLLEGGLQRPAFLIEPCHLCGGNPPRRYIRQDIEHRGPVAGGAVEFESQPPIHMHAALGIDHAHPLLREVPRFHPTEWSEGASNLIGHAPVSSHDKGNPPRVHSTKKLPGTEVTIGTPE